MRCRTDPDLVDAPFLTPKLVVTTPGRLILNEKVEEVMAEQFEVDDFPLPFMNYVIDQERGIDDDRRGLSARRAERHRAPG